MSIRSPLDAACFTTLPLTYADPAAGANFLTAPPLNRISTLALFNCTFVADVNVADRRLVLELYHLPHSWYLGATSHPVVASETWQVMAHPHTVLNTAASDHFLFLPLPDLPLFTDSMTLFLTVINKQAGDQISDVTAAWKVWPHHHTH